MSLLPVADGQRRLLELATPLGPEELPLAKAAGRYAAAPVIAARTQPSADLSMMDGYALRYADLPGPWTVVGESRAGRGSERSIGPGEAVRIFTGAPMPTGADTVLVQEEAAREGDRLLLDGEGPPGEGAHIRRRGYDFAEGSVLVEAGTCFTPARIALAATGGHGKVTVGRRPTVTLISTGDELVMPGDPVPEAALPASNALMLQAMIHDLADVRDGGLVPDRLDVLVDTFARTDSDVIVTTGGASVGDHDLIRPALARSGAALDFWRIAMRPGKPLLAGTLGRAIVLGLPGNPVAAFVTAHLFLRPLLRRLAGAARPLPIGERARLGAALPAAGTRDDYLRGVWAGGRVEPVGPDDSAALSGLARAELLIRRPRGAAAAAVDDLVGIFRIA